MKKCNHTNTFDHKEFLFYLGSIIPYKTEHYKRCLDCNNDRLIKKEEFENERDNTKDRNM